MPINNRTFGILNHFVKQDIIFDNKNIIPSGNKTLPTRLKLIGTKPDMYFFITFIQFISTPNSLYISPLDFTITKIKGAQEARRNEQKIFKVHCGFVATQNLASLQNRNGFVKKYPKSKTSPLLMRADFGPPLGRKFSLKSRLSRFYTPSL